MFFILIAQMPRGTCFLWDVSLTALHSSTDLIIAFSYFSIPALIFANRRLITPGAKPLLILFAAFIISGGIGHLIQVWNIWHDNYWIEGINKAITAVVSAYTVMQLTKMIPVLFSAQKDLEISQQLVRTDALTGLASRRALNEAIASALVDLCDRNTSYILMLLDLDRFKQVNDSLGHPAGDRLLQQVAKLMCKQVRSSDLVARLGGDEFAILLAACPLPRAIVIAEQLRNTIANMEFEHDHKIYRSLISASIGATTIDASMSAESLYHQADRALYCAKQQGKNQVTWANKDLKF
ncbi:diguanylate cyclase [Thalassoporum mexicanum PCC 7367]|uniref:GGDEF domain-containing protein n=1 Tax=Thalassoporum mexicanum TaxID=3457544 RepID=UPI00029FF17B|nr:GGDEF domain-containing protein [Pseudanabaena sp. PCC 7367]AFY69793.1 diguanylate cyclase [Pseudanabaena sp. PCC 7367]